MSLGRIGIVVAARLSSRRLPRKALLPIYNGTPMLGFLIERLKKSNMAHEIVLATSLEREDTELEDLALSRNVKCYRGDLEDVVKRYSDAAREYGLDTVVRITGDCPFVDGEFVDYCLREVEGLDFDLASTKGHFPVGLDCEIYRVKSMERAVRAGDMTSDHKEHLTLYLYDHKDEFSVVYVKPPHSWKKSTAVFTVDDSKDFLLAQQRIGAMRSACFDLESLVGKNPK